MGVNEETNSMASIKKCREGLKKTSGFKINKQNSNLHAHIFSFFHIFAVFLETDRVLQDKLTMLSRHSRFARMGFPIDVRIE